MIIKYRNIYLLRPFTSTGYNLDNKFDLYNNMLKISERNFGASNLMESINLRE